MNRLRIIPLDDTVAFPGMPVTLPVDVGTDDRVLPVEQCGRRVARELAAHGDAVTYTEFDGGHAVPREVAEAAMDWLVQPA